LWIIHNSNGTWYLLTKKLLITQKVPGTEDKLQ